MVNKKSCVFIQPPDVPVMSVTNRTHLLARRCKAKQKANKKINKNIYLKIGIESKTLDIFSQLNYAKSAISFTAYFYYRYFTLESIASDKIYRHERQSTYKTINRQFST